MCRSLCLLVLLLTALAAPASADPWTDPQTLLAGSEAAGLAPQGRADAYWATTLGHDSARAFELPAGGTPIDLERFGRPSSTVVLAAGRDKTVVMAAEDGGGSLLAYRLAPGGATEQTVLPVARARSAAVGPDGTVAVADLTRFAVAPPRGPFGAPQETAGDGRTFASDLAVAPDGTAYLLVGADDALTLYRSTPDGRVSARRLAFFGAAPAEVPARVAIDAGADGALAMAWTQPGPFDSPIRSVLLGLTRPAGGRFGLVQRLDGSTRADLDPQVAVLGDRRAVAAWVTSHVNRRPAPRGLVTSFSSPGPGSFGPGIPVGALAGRDARGPDLVRGSRGAAILAWASACAGCDTKVMVSAAGRSGRFPRPRAISSLGTVSTAPHVALDGTGGAAVAWTQRDPLTLVNPTAVFARTLRLPPPPRADRRGPRVRLTPLKPIRRALEVGTLPVRVSCSESCFAQLRLGRARAVTGTRGVARLELDRATANGVRRDLRRRGFTVALITASDRTGNVHRMSLRLRG